MTIDDLMDLELSATPGPWAVKPWGPDHIRGIDGEIAVHSTVPVNGDLIIVLRNLCPDLILLLRAANHISFDQSEQSREYYENTKQFNAALGRVNRNLDLAKRYYR